MKGRGKIAQNNGYFADFSRVHQNYFDVLYINDSKTQEP